MLTAISITRDTHNLYRLFPLCIRVGKVMTSILKTCLFGLSLIYMSPGFALETTGVELDVRIDNFLDEHRGTWHDLNVPETDGRTLYELIIRHKFTRALEIGTSTGHSAIWISKALNRTGGKLITIEINRRRHSEAVANFKQAGVAHLIDARLADAHELIYELEGPFDFIFSDADKDWYQQYMEVLLPKLAPGGCFVAHNVRRWGNRGGIASMLEYAKSQPDLETTIDTRGAGMSISCKKNT